MVADITKLPYKHGTVDEIWLIHVFEHIHIWQAEDALYHWHNILKPGGRLVVEVPCMDKILDNFKKKEVSPALTFLVYLESRCTADRKCAINGVTVENS